MNKIYFMIGILIKRLIPYLKNKYIIATLFFIVWVVFFDINNVFSQFEFRQKYDELMITKSYYENEIRKNHQEIEELSINEDTLIDQDRIRSLEKFAREKYLMKKENEDIFIIENKNIEK